MNSVKKLSYSITLLSTMASSSILHAATISYDWAGKYGSGQITFLDTNIKDAKNFTVAFDTVNVANISYTFNNGTSIEAAENFSGISTLQSLTELGGAMFTSRNGIIDGWTFNYDQVYSILPLDISFTGSSTTSTIYCITTPCPVDTAAISFIGNFASESNTGSWHLQAVPLPAAAWLFVSGLAGLAGFKQITRNKINAS